MYKMYAIFIGLHVSILYEPPHSASCKTCSFACVHISKCLVGRVKAPPVKVAVGGGLHITSNWRSTTLHNHGDRCIFCLRYVNAFLAFHVNCTGTHFMFLLVSWECHWSVHSQGRLSQWAVQEDSRPVDGSAVCVGTSQTLGPCQSVRCWCQWFCGGHL